LPSEAEWENACRGTDARIYPWGNETPTRQLANFGGNEGTLTDVGNYPEGKSSYGLLDMAGNVWEWTSSLWGKSYDKPDFGYPYDAKDGRENLDVSHKILRSLRGGAFNYDVDYVRCARRYGYFPGNRVNDVGFRVVSPGF